MATYVTKTHLENFTEKLLVNDKKIRDELKQEISNLPSGGGSGSSYTLPTASTTTLGGVKVDGTTVTINPDGVISATASGSGSYTLPKATDTTLGGVKVDNDTITVNSEGVISATKELPIGGTTGQMLVKKSGTNYDVEWKDAPQGGAAVDVATTDKAGIVKPDGTSTTVDADGTIHANAQVSADEIKTQVETYLTNNPVSAGFTVDNPFKGKIANFLGDSQTNPGNKGLYTDKGYYDWVKEILELDSYNIYAKNGSALATVPANDVGAISLRYTEMSEDADLIIVMGGVNDRWHNAELGNFGDNTVNTVYGAMEVLCDGLMTKYPGKTIVFVTPTEEDNANCASSNTTGVTVKQIANAMKIVCDKYGMKLYDANTQLGIYPKNAANAAQFTKDKLHLNTKGHELLGKGLSNYILFGSPASYTIINVNESGSGAGGSGGSGGSGSDVSVSSVSISGANSLNVNNSIELTATVSPSNATNKNVTWSIDSDTYATIAPNGNKCTVTSKSSVGTATITVTTEDGNKTATKTIFVVDDSSTGLNLSGKKVTSSTYNWGASFLALFVPTDGLVGGETITITGGISELSNVKRIHEGTTVYSATSDVVSDNFGASSKVSNNYVISGTTDSFTLTATLTSAISSFSYMRVLFAIDPTSTASAMSYTISNMAVSVNGVQKDIVAYGPFMSGDNMTIE